MCPSSECLKKAVKSKALERAFGTKYRMRYMRPYQGRWKREWESAKLLGIAKKAGRLEIGDDCRDGGRAKKARVISRLRHRTIPRDGRKSGKGGKSPLYGAAVQKRGIGTRGRARNAGNPGNNRYRNGREFPFQLAADLRGQYDSAVSSG